VITKSNEKEYLNRKILNIFNREQGENNIIPTSDKDKEN
jgi:hypothetical protein